MLQKFSVTCLSCYSTTAFRYVNTCMIFVMPMRYIIIKEKLGFLDIYLADFVT